MKEKWAKIQQMGIYGLLFDGLQVIYNMNSMNDAKDGQHHPSLSKCQKMLMSYITIKFSSRRVHNFSNRYDPNIISITLCQHFLMWFILPSPSSPQLFTNFCLIFRSPRKELLVLAALSYFPSKSLTLQIKTPLCTCILMLGAKTNLNSAYREFSRQRYNKYRHQFPSMREPDIILMIIREWQALGTPKKKSLSERLDARGTAKEEQCFSTAQKTGEKASRLQFSPTPYSKTHLPKATVYPPLFPIRKEEQDQDSEYHRNSQRFSEQHKSDRSSYSLIVRDREQSRRGASSTNRNYQYINFYKYYYAKLMHEHSKWTPAQIVQIIKLEWKKRRQMAKSKKIAKKVTLSVKRQKQLSGKVFFGKSKSLDHKVRDRMWRRLPFESRMRYVQWSLGEDQARRRSEQVVWRSKTSTLNKVLSKK